MPNIDVYKSSYSVYGSAGNIDVLSTEGFFTFKKEVFELARLAFYENSLIGQESSVPCPHWRVSVLSGLNLGNM